MKMIYFAANPEAEYQNGLPHVGATNLQVTQILQIVFGVLAALAVFFIVIAGLRYITAQGNPQEIAKAKGTIIFALVGLLIAIFAQAIVTLGLSKI